MLGLEGNSLQVSYSATKNISHVLDALESGSYSPLGES